MTKVMSGQGGRILQGQFIDGRFRLQQRATVQAVRIPAPANRPANRQPSHATPGVSGVAQPLRLGNAVLLPAALVPATSSGQPLPTALQARMQAALGMDFSDVRVHVGPEASAIGARAFTIGSHLYFAPGEYSPNTTHGERLIGHELAHVVQQKTGRVRNPFGSGLAVVEDAGLEAEANRLSMRVAMASPTVPPLQAKPTPGGTIRRHSHPPGKSGASIQMWEASLKQVQPDPGDDERILYLVNETGSWHGHTVLVAEGWEPDGHGGGRRWFNTWSFEPDDQAPGSRTLGSFSGGMQAILRVRHESLEGGGGGHHHLSPDREIGTAYRATAQQFERLLAVIEEEKRLIESGKVKYVGVGHPIGTVVGLVKWEWHDNCNSWVNKVLRKAGIISSLWGISWYLPNVPALSVKTKSLFGV